MSAISNIEQTTRPINGITPHPNNPRGPVDPNALEIADLSADIKRRGIIQPIVITPEGLILAGHRRYAAAVKAGLTDVPVTVRTLKPHEYAEEYFLAENMQRQDLSPLEEALMIGELRSRWELDWDRKVTLKDLARRLDMEPSVVRTRLFILQMPDYVRDLCHNRELPVNSAPELAKLANRQDDIKSIVNRLVNRQLTLKQLPKAVKAKLAEAKHDPSDGKRTDMHHHHVAPETAITRETALANLDGKASHRISLFNVKRVLESTCCSCGLMGDSSACVTCPLPRFVNGLIGRSDN